MHNSFSTFRYHSSNISTERHNRSFIVTERHQTTQKSATRSLHVCVAARHAMTRILTSRQNKQNTVTYRQHLRLINHITLAIRHRTASRCANHMQPSIQCANNMQPSPSGSISPSWSWDVIIPLISVLDERRLANRSERGLAVILCALLKCFDVRALGQISKNRRVSTVCAEIAILHYTVLTKLVI